MRPSSSQLLNVLSESFDTRFEADLWYGEDRRAEGLTVVSPSLQWDASAEVEGSGSLTILWSDDHATGAPVETGELFAPFGSRLVVFCVVSAGDFEERVQVGEFDITEVPSVSGEPFMWGETVIHPGDRVDVTLRDRMVEVQRDRFVSLQSPSQLASVWDEIGHLTGFQLTRTLSDKPIPRSVVYEESRVSAVQDLAAVLGGVAFMEWDGTLSMRPIEPGAPVAELVMGEHGTIIQTGASLSSENVFNGVVIRSETGDQQSILAEAWVETGPLRATMPGQPRTPYHRVPMFYSSPFITTTAQAQSAAPGLLQRFSTPRATELEVTCVFNPLLQVGDVVTVADHKWVWTIRLTRVPLQRAAVMTVQGDVIDRVLR